MWAESDSMPLVIVQMCRSWISQTPGAAAMVLRTRSISRCPGVLSIKIAMACFTRLHDE